MDKHQFLCMDSCYSKHCKTAIPYSQVLHLQRIISEEENLLKTYHYLQKLIFWRGYDKQLLNLEIQQALDIPSEVNHKWKQNQDKSVCIPLVVTHHPILPPFHSTTKCHLAILHTLEQLQRVFLLPLLIAFCHSRNMKDFLDTRKLPYIYCLTLKFLCNNYMYAVDAG